MNEQEKEGLFNILRTLSVKDLYSITDTTTKHMVKAMNAEEAIKAILSYSENASVVLRRKKIKKQSLFCYLRCHGVFVPINGEKIDYIRACLQLWNSTQTEEDTSLDDIDIEDMDSVPLTLDELTPPIDPQADEIQELGTQFSHWFFANLNSLTDFGSHHFYPDCKLYIYVRYKDFKNEEFCIAGSDHAALYLAGYVQQQRFFFKPHTFGDSVKTHQDEHGLVKVITCGIVHQDINCIGLFDVSFGLVSDPTSQYTWKIKVLHLVMQMNAENVHQISEPMTVPFLCQ